VGAIVKCRQSGFQAVLLVSREASVTDAIALLLCFLSRSDERGGRGGPRGDSGTGG